LYGLLPPIVTFEQPGQRPDDALGDLAKRGVTSASRILNAHFEAGVA
jgi:hypothetical protein